jgi:methylmalonyl-CoA mutase C-terminal domain/subunit
MQRKVRVLVGKPGLDGHDRGAKVVAAALRDAGMEVIYTGLHQTPEQVVEAAVQEDVDVVALSVLSGAHMTLFPEILELMRARGIGDRLLTGGGIIPNDDMSALAGLGVGRLFGPGTNTQDIVGYIRSWYAGVHGAAALPPLPPPPGRPEPMPGAGARPLPRPAGARTAAPTRTRPAAPAKRAKATRTTAKPPKKRVSGVRGEAGSGSRASKAAKSAKPAKPAKTAKPARSPKRGTRSTSRKRG